MRQESVGFDLTRVSRCANFIWYSSRVLQKIFTRDEIAYCFAVPELAAQRFAVRFAAKEAFYKALCSMHPHLAFPFFLVCRAFSLKSLAPYDAFVDWKGLGVTPCLVLVSVSHEIDIAGAVVFLRNV